MWFTSTADKQCPPMFHYFLWVIEFTIAFQTKWVCIKFDRNKKRCCFSHFFGFKNAKPRSFLVIIKSPKEVLIVMIFIATWILYNSVIDIYIKSMKYLLLSEEIKNIEYNMKQILFFSADMKSNTRNRRYWIWYFWDFGCGLWPCDGTSIGIDAVFCSRLPATAKKMTLLHFDKRFIKSLNSTFWVRVENIKYRHKSCII